MLKETGYQEKFEMLKPWMPGIIDSVKKDLKNEHLKIDRAFCKRYFLGKNPNNVTVEEMVQAYLSDIEKGNTGLGEFIATRWITKHTDVYGFFEEKLRSVSKDFEQLEVLNHEFSSTLMQESVKKFSAINTYLFAVLNSVVFPQEVYAKLRAIAETEIANDTKAKEAIKEQETVEALQKRHERELAALTDRYEKKLSGFERKYLRDMEAMKKQVSLLQKKLLELSS